MSDNLKVYEIDKGVYILDSAGTAPEGQHLKQQTDHSFQVVRDLFKTGALKVACLNEESTPVQSSRRK